MHLVIDRGGRVCCLYGELIPLTELGEVSIRRASRVEPQGDGWYADLAPVHGPRLGPFPVRSQALRAETEWLEGRLADGHRL
jgi:hypothetical protein